MANDDELAESFPDEPAGDSGPRISEYTPDVARLDVLIDRLGELIGVTIQVAGGKSPKIRPVKRPETAFSRAAARRRDRRIGSLIDEVLAAQERWSETSEPTN